MCDSNSYPSRNLFLTTKDFCESIDYLKSFESVFFDENQTEIDLGDGYHRSDIISGMFTDEIRIKSKRSNEPSPEEWWNKNRSLEPHKSKLRGLDLEQQNDYVYGFVKGCGTFRPRVMVSIVKKFFQDTNIKVLDFCSGWGDRLIAAISIGVDGYLGFDTNTNLFEGYENIINYAFEHGFITDKSKFVLKNEPFQNSRLNSQKFDLVFTSPPYFDLELYSNCQGDSVTSFPSLKEWKIQFLYESIDKAWNALSINGYFVLIITDTAKSKYVDDMFRYISTFPSERITDHNYSYTTNGKRSKPQPIWIWKKKGDRSFKFNIPFIIHKHLIQNQNHESHHFVIRDDELIGGTKQRPLDLFLCMFSEKEIIYVGPTAGYAQLAIAYVAKELQKSATLFLQGKPTSITKKAMGYGATVKTFADSIVNIENKAKEYAKKSGGLLLSFGFESAEYEKLLGSCLKDLCDCSAFDSCGVVTLAVGSGTLSRCLLRTFPNLKIRAVRVGRGIFRDQYTDDMWKRMTVVDATKFYKFNENCDDKVHVEYPTIYSYDAKACLFVRDGDMVWNVGKL